MTSEPRPSLATTILVDAGAVVVFCILGGLSHSLGQPDAVMRIVFSIWPFLASLILVHAVALLLKAPAARIVPGIGVWLVTVAGGMVLRALTGQGTAWPFVIVTAVVLALLLIGWRVANALLKRRRTA